MKQRPSASSGTRLALHLLLVALLVAPPGIPAAWASPRGEQVANGQAEFLRDGSLTVIRASDGAIINYESFDILSSETVQFVQPDAASRVLNRVQSFDPTHIDGSLVANGIVYIVNPVGIFFGGDAIVDVGGLVAASGQISDSDFLGGVDHVTELAGAVENRGRIEAGSVALIGRSVANHGSILLGDAGDGLIALVAGDDVLLTRRDGHVVVRVDAPPEDPGVAGIEQTGTLDAGGGGVVLTTGDLYSLAINHEGITRGGDIQIAGGEGGLVRVSGSLDASDDAPHGTGGSVEVTGDRVALVGADVDASGGNGGGEIRIGGALRGGEGTPTARRTVVDAASSLRADAIDRGDGGEVIVWADEATAFQGTISARGGRRSGDGGFAEVSAPVLHASGAIDLGAPEGRSGTLLYDPQDIEIVGGTMDGDDAPDLNDDVLETDGGLLGEVLFGDVGTGANPFVIYESEIEGIDANVVLEAENSITVSGTFDHDADGAGPGDPGVNVVLLQPGNSLTMRTRNEPGDDTGSGETPGIDLTDGGALAALEWRTVDGSIAIRTGNDGSGGGGTGAAANVTAGTLTTQGGAVAVSTTDGAIAVDRIDTSAPADTSENGGAISVVAGGSHDVTVGNLVSTGADGVSSPGARGNGGSVTVSADDGSIEIAGIEASGGSGEGNGGAGGTVRVQQFGAGNVTLLGDIVATGGDRTEPLGQTVFGGTGGSVTVTNVEGAISVLGIDASGGDGGTRAGGGNAILIAANGDPDQGELAGDVFLGGLIRSEDGTGFVGPFSPNAQVSIVLGGGTLDAADLPVHISADTAVGLRAGTIGESVPIVVQGGTSSDGLVQVVADGDARVDIDTPTIDQLQVQQEALEGTIAIERADGTGTLLEVVGDPDAQGGLGTSTVAEIDTTDADLATSFIVNVADADLVVPSGSTVFGAAGLLQTAGDVVLGTGAGPAIEMVAGAGGEASDLTLAADIDADGQGAIDHDGGAGPHIVSNGGVRLDGVTIGTGSPGVPLVIEGGGEATGLLEMRVSGDGIVDVVGEVGFTNISVTQRDVAGDVTIDQVGGDQVRITGTAAGANDPGFATVTLVDTEANGTGFGFNLVDEGLDPDPDDGIGAEDPDLILPTGQVRIGGNGLFSTTGDLVLGDGPGSAVEIGGEGLALEADRNLNRTGAIVNGAADVSVSAPDAQVMLFGGTGVGTPESPIVLLGATQIGAEVLDQGGIHLRSEGSGDLILGRTGAPLLGGAVQSVPGLRVFEGPGDIDVVHAGGDISLEGTIRTFDDEGDARILAEDDGALIYFAADPDPTTGFPIFASTGGSLDFGNPVEVREDAAMIGGDIHFAGTIDSEIGETPTRLSITTSGSVVVGDSIGETAPLSLLRIVDREPVFDPETGLITGSAGNIQLFGDTVATTGIQHFGNSVVLSQDTTFSAATNTPNLTGDAVTFLLDLDGPGAADIAVGAGNVLFGGNVGATASLAGLSVDFTGPDPGAIAFIGTETVSTGAGGITLAPGGRDSVPSVATIFKTGIPALLDPPDSGFPDTPKPASSVGPLTFTTTGDFVVGRNEKISVADKLVIQANHVEAGDLSAFKIDIDAPSYTILGRDPGDVLLAGGGEQMDLGVDIVANRVTLGANPVWDGVGTTPTFYTQTGGVDTPGNLEAFDLRLIEESGSKVDLADFTLPDGTLLDLTGNGPMFVGNPASETVQQGNRLALLIPPRSSRTEANTTSEASAAEVIDRLECVDVGRGVPQGCAPAAASSDRVLASARLKQTASAYRETAALSLGPARDALRDALVGSGVWTASGDVDGSALRRSVESAPRGRPAAAYLDRLNEILTEVRLMNLSEATTVEVERTLLERWSKQLGLPGLDAAALGRAAGSARDGLVL